MPLAALLWLLRIIYLEYRQDRVPILLYHRLVSKSAAQKGEIRDDEMIFVSYDAAFAEQMAYLNREGYTTLDFDDYLAIRDGNMPLPQKPVIITFDDGYLSNYTMAFPQLKKCNLKATLFVALEPNEYSLKCVEGVDSFLNASQLFEMSAHQVSIQSHTLTHCVLSALSDKEALYELTESRRQIALITGRSVDHIAIPRAGYSRRIRHLVQTAGYKTACCNNKGSACNLSDLLALPRIVIERDMNISDFARSLTPRASVMLRIVGNIKRIPERIAGPQLAKKVRDILYGGPFHYFFTMKTLKMIIPAFAALYLVGSLLFSWHMVGQ